MNQKENPYGGTRKRIAAGSHDAGHQWDVAFTMCIRVVAELAIADHLNNGPHDVGSLAATTGTNPDALYRRLLEAVRT